MSDESFFFLRQDLFGEATGVEIVGHTEASADFDWVGGVAFERPPRETFAIEDGAAKNYPDFFDTTVPVMSQRLCELVMACGVDNLATYPVVLRNPREGSERTDYSAVNVVGLVDAVDVAASVHEMRRGKPRFKGAIVVVASKTQGLRAFRLPHSPRFIVVAEAVARRIQAAGLDSVLVQPTTAYRGV